MSNSPFNRPAFPLSVQRRIHTYAPCLVLAAAAAFAACGKDGTGPGAVVSASLTPADTSIFKGDSATIEAVVQYEFGTGPAETVAWGVSDSSVLELSVVGTGVASVTGLTRGDAYVIALINTEFWDSSEVRIGDIGDIRWRAEGVGANTYSGAALDASGRIYTVYWDSFPGTLSALTPGGEVVYSVPGAWADFAGTVLSDGTAYSNGSQYVQRNAPDGSQDWQAACGTSYSGIAVDLDGSVACVSPGSLISRCLPG